MTKVLILGAGKMGSAIAKELAVQDVAITLWNRSVARLQSVKAEIQGSSFSTSNNLMESLPDSDIIITLLTSGQSVEDVLLAPGVLQACKASAIIVDMSTSGVATASKLNKEISLNGLRFVDAPVSGSIATIAAHQLLVMASGDEGAINEITPILMKFSKKVANLGPAGSGQVMKLAVNLIVHSLNSAIAESLAIATAAGISIDRAYDILEESVVAAPFLKYKRPAFTTPGVPVAMRIDTVLKDMELIQGLAASLKVELRVTSAVKDAYAAAVAQGLSEKDMASLLDAYR